MDVKSNDLQGDTGSLGKNNLGVIPNAGYQNQFAFPNDFVSLDVWFPKDNMFYVFFPNPKGKSKSSSEAGPMLSPGKSLETVSQLNIVR